MKTERRRHARAPISRPAKLRCARTGKSYAGRTCDISDGGMMIELDLKSHLMSGEPVEVVVAWSNRNMLVRTQDLTSATVMRCLGLSGRQRVAVRINECQDPAMTA